MQRVIVVESRCKFNKVDWMLIFLLCVLWCNVEIFATLCAAYVCLFAFYVLPDSMQILMNIKTCGKCEKG
jgi:hypothetical protein